MNIIVRPAVIEDADLIVYFVKQLAIFEKHDPNLVRLTPEKVRADGFSANPQFRVLIAESDLGQPVGFALFFNKYSTWEAVSGLYIEELYVEEEYRGMNIGEQLVSAVCQIAVQQDSARVELSVLDWNPARGFYEKLGMVYESEWLLYRMERESIVSNAVGS